MSRLLSTDPVRVVIGPCECPGKPHEEDEAWFRPRLTVAGGMEASGIVGGAASYPSTGALGRDLGMVYLTDGLLRWNILDDKGKPIPCTREVLESGALDWDTTLLPLADGAADLYSESVMRPLVERAEALREAAEKAQATEQSEDSTSSPSGQTSTPEPTSPKPA